MDPFPPTEQQKAVISHRGGNLLVFAGPGTGKTETLARRFASLVADGIEPRHILMLTFSRRAADEMRDRVLLRLRQLRASPLAVPELFVKTFHSFCGRLLDGDNARVARRDLLTPVKERLLWRQVMRSGSLALSSFNDAVIESDQFAADCLNVIAHLKGQGADAQRLTELSGGDKRLLDIACIFAAMEAERSKANLRDFRDLVNEAVAALRDPNSAAIRWLRQADFRHVLVDEFQDSDLMQLRLLEVMRDVLSPAPVFCFVGDVNQSIYRFRGASPSNVEAARRAFACQILPLDVNRRSAQAILGVANADTTLDAASLTSAADSEKRGSVRLVRPRTTDDEVRVIRDAVVAKVATGMAPRAIAVLLRQTRPYQELIIDALADAGVPVAALPAAGFHEDSLIDTVLTALRLLAQPNDELLWRRLLSNPIVGFRPIDVGFAFDAGRRAGIAEARTALRVNAPSGFRPIAGFLSAWKRCEAAYDKSTPLELVQTIVYELDLLRPVRERSVVNGFDLTASPLRLDALLQAAEAYDDVAEFIVQLDETIGLLSDATQPPPSVTLGVRVMSIHAAKGLEFEFVVIPQVLDGVLPASERPSRLLSDNTLRALASESVSVSPTSEEARCEEHSLWYVALTRAKSEVLATAALVDDEGIDQQLSPFANAIPETVDTVSVDARSTAPKSTATVPVDTGPAAKAPIVLSMDSLSPTGISTFITCPRRFFYRDVLHLAERDEDATQYGRVLHEVLRRFHEIETNFESIGNPQAAVAKYRTTLHDIIAEETAVESVDIGGLGPLARYEREDLERRLDLYAQHLVDEAATEPFSVLACERKVISTFGDLTVRGKADRIDRLARGGLVVRDYKSGRRHGVLATALHRAFDRLDEGDNIFGDAPEGLNLQTILYIPGVEADFGDPVRRLDYLYFRGRSADEGDLLIDSTFVTCADEADGRALTRAQIERVGRDIASRIVALCRDGALLYFPTAHDERTCTFCSFTRICPGAGALA